MENTIIDSLNKILTNTLEYKTVLEKLEELVSHDATKEKLSELAKIREKHAQDLIKMIGDNGGDVESSTRITDNEMISWIQSPVPEKSEMEEIISFLIPIEKNALEAYRELDLKDKISTEEKEILEKHQKEIEVTIKYFETAQQTLEKR